MKKRLVALILATAMGLTTFAGCGSKELDGSAVVAEVGGEEIKLDLANFYARYQQSMYETYYASFLGEDMWETELTSGYTYEDSVKESIMEAIQTMYVIKQHASDYSVELTDEEKEAISKAAASFVEANEDETVKVISGGQETVEEYLTLITIQSKMYQEMIKEADTDVSDEEAAQKKMSYIFVSYNETNEDGESVEVSDEEKENLKEIAQEIADAATSVEAMESAANKKNYEVSETTFDAETTSPATELIEAADALKEGECTGVVVTDSGCYVGIVTSLMDEEATETKKASIISEREQETYTNLCTEWLEAADATVKDKVWNQVDFEKVGVTIKDTTEESDESSATDTTEDSTTEDSAE